MNQYDLRAAPPPIRRGHHRFGSYQKSNRPSRTMFGAIRQTACEYRFTKRPRPGSPKIGSESGSSVFPSWLSLSITERPRPMIITIIIIISYSRTADLRNAAYPLSNGKRDQLAWNLSGQLWIWDFKSHLTQFAAQIQHKSTKFGNLASVIIQTHSYSLVKKNLYPILNPFPPPLVSTDHFHFDKKPGSLFDL